METASANLEKCLIVLSGIPGCGKTTLSKLIGEHIEESFGEEKSTKKSFGVIIISYDDLLPEKIILDDDSQQTWKSQREEIVLCVDYLLNHISTSVDKFEESIDGVNDALWEKFTCIVRKQITSTVAVAIVIDDNMYYSSMRHRYYQLARKHTCGFCQVFLTCNVKEALKRNRQRNNNPVPGDIIVTMATKIEPPDSQENTWETNSIVVNSQNGLQSELQRISTLVMTAINNPVQPIEEIDYAVRAESRQICSSNVIHQADQILRKIVSQKMMDSKALSLDKPELQKISKQYVDARKLCLDRIKTEEVIIENTVNQSEKHSNKNCELYQEILRKFEQLLKDVT